MNKFLAFVLILTLAAAAGLGYLLFETRDKLDTSAEELSRLKVDLARYETDLKHLTGKADEGQISAEEVRAEALSQLSELEKVATQLDSSLNAEHQNLQSLKHGLEQLIAAQEQEIQQQEQDQPKQVEKVEAPHEQKTTEDETPTEETVQTNGRREYLIGVGDVLHISVWQNPDLDREVTVRPDGRISFPLVDEVLVEGLTLSKVDQLMTKELADYIRHTDVSVSLSKSGAEKITILGSVRKPGVYTIDGEKTIFDALAMAEGETPDASLQNVLVVRKGEGNPWPQRINLTEALQNTDFGENIMLTGQDVVYVPSATGSVEGKVSVMVLGEVQKPGIYTLSGRQSVVEAIAQAGGLTQDAVLKDVLVMKGNSSGPANKVDLNAVFRQGRAEEDFLLDEQDIVFVPSIADTTGGKISVLVLGEVIKPGVHELTTRKSVLEALAAAGGPNRDAVLKSVVVIRGDLEDPDAYLVNLEKALKKAHIEQDIALGDQDIVYVPRKLIADINYFLDQILGPLGKTTDIQSDIKFLRD